MASNAIDLFTTLAEYDLMSRWESRWSWHDRFAVWQSHKLEQCTVTVTVSPPFEWNFTNYKYDGSPIFSPWNMFSHMPGLNPRTTRLERHLFHLTCLSKWSTKRTFPLFSMSSRWQPCQSLVSLSQTQTSSCEKNKRPGSSFATAIGLPRSWGRTSHTVLAHVCKLERIVGAFSSISSASTWIAWIYVFVVDSYVVVCCSSVQVDEICQWLFRSRLFLFYKLSQLSAEFRIAGIAFKFKWKP